MGEWRRMGLDDTFLIKQVLLFGTRLWCWAHWAWVSIE